MVDRSDLPLEEHMQPSIPPATAEPRQAPQSRAQGLFILTDAALIAYGAPMRPHHTTGAPLREGIGALQIAHGSTPSRGRHQFFVAMSFKARLSNVKSATTCFSFRFSSSSWRSRRSWLTSSPPYCAFQR